MALVEQQVVPPSIGVEPRWEAAHRDVTGRLAVRHAEVDSTLIEAIVARHFDAYLDARITIYVPILVERAAEDELRRATTAMGRIRRP